MSSSFRRRSKPSIINSADATLSQKHQQKPLRRLRGTKPWTGGATLTSFGLREVDAILGGGQPLGTAILIEEDRWTFDLARCLARYWGAEAVVQGQTLLLPATKPDLPAAPLPPTPLHLSSNQMDSDFQSAAGSWGSSPRDVRSFADSLPRDLHLDKLRSVDEGRGKGEADQAIAGFAAIEEGECDDEDYPDEEGGPKLEKDEDEAEEGLTIAWQYRTSVQRQRLGHTASSSSSRKEQKEVYCHSYDLNGRMVEQHPPTWLDSASGGSNIVFADVPCRSCPTIPGCPHRQCGMGLYRRLLVQIRRILQSNPERVVRLLVLNAPIGAASVALPLLLAYIRSHALPVVVLLTVRPWLGSPGAAALFSLQRASDSVFRTVSFASQRRSPPPEYSDLAGILTILRVSTPSTATGQFCNVRRGPADRYGMKRDRRKLTVKMLHLPPEEFSEGGGGSVGSGVRSGGGRLPEATSGTRSVGCGGGGTGKNALDF